MQFNSKLNTLYEKVLVSLNEAQQNAVHRIEGPVLVLAGPGTGKTQILAARIAQILKETDSLPENILCLTYTDSGAIAMRKRLLQFIGPEAFQVHLFTFHSFCNSIIQENLDYFGLRALDPVSELEQIEFVHRIIDEFPKGHPLKRYTGEVYYETGKLLNLYEMMKRENWKAPLIKERVKEYLAGLPFRDEYIYKKDSKYGKKGTLKQALYDDELKRMNQLCAAADTFDAYQSLLRENNRYDFSDMILWVIDAFTQKPEILSLYQERYLYFLVDEFQDTSGSQNQVLEMLLSFWDKPNVFCVGDDDQSIFRFQGANVENIHHFIKKYEPSVITLTENYRSTQLILDSAVALIRENKTRIDENKVLHASNENLAALSERPEIRAYHNPMHEAAGIAMEIEQLQLQGVSLNEIAVIYRKHAQADEMIRYLQSKKITVNTRRRIDILKEPFIKKLINLLLYLASELKKAHTGEVYIYELLHYDFFRIDPVEIARISVLVYKKNFSERVTSWREEIKNAGKGNQQDLFNQSSSLERLKNASELIEGWIKAGANLTLQALIEEVIAKSGILYQALTGEEKSTNMTLLHTFFDFVKAECSRKPGITLHQLLNRILLMESEGIAISAQRISYDEEGVNFITAHSSKGLEFGYVYLIGCNNKAWEDAGSHYNFRLPDNIFEIHSADSTEDDRRLFYVAMTRAKRQLVLSYPEFDNNAKELEKSRFVAELENNEGLTPKMYHLSNDVLTRFELNIHKTDEDLQQSINLFDNPFVDELLEKYSLSVTHLNAFLKCPVSFYFNNLIRIPAPMSASMTFGSAVHYALEKLFRNMNLDTEKKFGEVSDLLKDFKWYMRRNEDGFTETEYARRVEYGEHILSLYYNKYITEWNKITSIERSYRNVVVDGVPLNGKLDKLEFDGNFVNVVDYKTGQFKNAMKKFEGPDEEKTRKALEDGKEPVFEVVHGGDYWRQGVFYKLLMDNDTTKTWKMRSTEFDFIEPDRNSGEFFKRKLEITDKDIAIVKGQISTTYHRIMNKEFNKGCEKADCQWCNFVKDYYSPLAATSAEHDLKTPFPQNESNEEE